MKKIVFLIAMLVVATTATKAQLNYATVNATNATLLQPAGSYIFYGDQVMNKQQCAEFLSTHHQPAYEKFQSGLKCTKAGWWTLGAGLAVDLAGSMLVAFAPKEDGEGNDAMFWSGAGCIIAGGLAVIASLPTLYIGYVRMDQAIDMFNVSQATAPRASLTIQGSENGIGLALHF
jgi:hypothetical protein